MGFWQKFSFQKLVFCLIFFAVSSCAKDSLEESANKNFEKKYGQQVKKISADRVPTKQQNKEVVVSTAPTPEELQATASDKAKQDYYSYVDVAQFGEKIPQAYLPNGEVYERTRGANPSNTLPPDMFEIAYNTNLYPPFRRAGVEFDRIEIPPFDAYGVKTEMSEKTYLLAGNASLQRNIDLVNSTKTPIDMEVSEIVIREHKQLKRKEKMIKIFGEDSIEIAELDKAKEAVKKEEKSEEKKSETAAKTTPAPAQQQSGFISRIVKN